MIERAKEILKENDRGGYTIPTERLYPFQWNWDSVFCALGISFLDLPRAWQEIEKLLEAQWTNGMVPHIVFRKVNPDYFPGPEVWKSPNKIPTSCYSQPPVLASVLKHLLEKDGEYKRPIKLHKELYKKTLLWHSWWMRERRDKKTGMIYVVHPWESGRDNSIDFDSGMKLINREYTITNKRKDTTYVNSDERPSTADYECFLSILERHKKDGWDYRKMRQGPFCMADPGIFFILLRAHHDLIFLAKEWGDREGEELLVGWIKEMENSRENYWNPAIKCFASINLLTDKFSDVISNSAFLFWYSRLNDKEKSSTMLGHLESIAKKVDILIPSADPSHSEFNPKCYWRGPVWAIMNFMIARGLGEIKSYRELTLAKKIKSDTLKFIEKSGFYEYYNPVDSSPLGGRKFSWTAAIYIVFIMIEKEKNNY